MLAGSALSQLRSHWPAHSAVTTAAHFRSRSILRPCHAVLLGPLFPLVVTACHWRSLVTPSCGTARLSAIAPLVSRLLVEPPQPPGRSTASSNQPPQAFSRSTQPPALPKQAPICLQFQPLCLQFQPRTHCASRSPHQRIHAPVLAALSTGSPTCFSRRCLLGVGSPGPFLSASSQDWQLFSPSAFRRPPVPHGGFCSAVLPALPLSGLYMILEFSCLTFSIHLLSPTSPSRFPCSDNKVTRTRPRHRASRQVTSMRLSPYFCPSAAPSILPRTAFFHW